MSIRLSLELIVVAVLSLMLLDARVELGLARVELGAHVTAERVISASHKVKLEEARGRYEEEIKRLRDGLNNPVQPIRLCPYRAGQGTGTPTHDGGPQGGGVHEVLGGDSEVRPDGGPDISRLSGLFVYQCERVAADLREEQRVR